MTLSLGTAARNAACDAAVDLIDGGAAAGKLKIRAGGTLLATFTLADPAFENAGTGAVGQARAFGVDGINPVSAGNPLTTTTVAAGTADNYEATDSDDNIIWTGSVTATGGGGDLQLDNTVLAASQEVRITSWTHTQPA